MDRIIDHSADKTAVKRRQGLEDSGGSNKPRMTTKGWKLLIQWMDKTTFWIPLKDLKELQSMW
jgi:hypothetical protein